MSTISCPKGFSKFFRKAPDAQKPYPIGLGYSFSKKTTEIEMLLQKKGWTEKSVMAADKPISNWSHPDEAANIRIYNGYAWLVERH